MDQGLMSAASNPLTFAWVLNSPSISLLSVLGVVLLSTLSECDPHPHPVRFPQSRFPTPSFPLPPLGWD